MLKTLICFILIAGLCACSQKGDETVTIVEHGKETEYLIHLKKVTDSLTMEISEVASDFQFIPLETKEECLLNRGLVLVTENYILIQKSKYGILQFNRNGKFIRTLVRKGKGPKEYMNADWTVDENTQTLYMSASNKENYFLSYDLNSGEYLGTMNKAISGRSNEIELIDDNTFIVTNAGYLGDATHPYFLYWQNKDGELLKGIKAPANSYVKGGQIFLTNNEPYRYQIHDKDTIFSIIEDQLMPFMVFDFGEENPPSIRYVGHKRMNIYFEAGSWVQFYNFYITKIEKHEKGSYTSGAVANYLLDKKSAKVYHSGNLFFNPTHHLMESHLYQYIRFQPNGVVHIYFQAIDLLEQAELALADPKFDEPYRSQLKKIVSNLSVDDNPVLVIGKLR